MASGAPPTTDLAAWIPPEMVFEPLSAPDAEGVLRELAERLASHDERLDARRIAAGLAEREALGSTALGDGVAVPHCKVDEGGRVHVGLARHVRGIPFRAPDERPVELFFVVVSPRLATGPHLQALAAIARALREPESRGRLLAAQTTGDLRLALASSSELERAS